MTNLKAFPLCALLLVAPALRGAGSVSPADALAQGKLSVNARLRYESVGQTGLRDAAALTLRTRLGFTTAPLAGWKAMIEAENIVAADGDSYSQAGLNPGGAGRAVIADPELTGISQAFLSGMMDRTTLTVGRQRLVLDNARFIGDSGWRQNMQTFDAVVLQDRSLDNTTLTYAYLDRINRVFGDRHAQGYWQSASHLFNASYAGFAAGTITGYAYLLDFRKPASAANSCATYGASFAGGRPLSAAVRLSYRFEAATQSDYGSSALNYSATYTALEAGLGFKAGGLTLGREVLGSGGNVGFKTPLATLHAYDGWADLFLATPAAGLRDTYVKAAASLPDGVSLLAFYHQFDTATDGSNLGHESDVQLSRKFGRWLTGLVKFADFRHDSPAFPNVRKIWLQVEFAY